LAYHAVDRAGAVDDACSRAQSPGTTAVCIGRRVRTGTLVLLAAPATGSPASRVRRLDGAAGTTTWALPRAACTTVGPRRQHTEFRHHSSFRLHYSSLVTPRLGVRLRPADRHADAAQAEAVLGDFDPARYEQPPRLGRRPGTAPPRADTRSCAGRTRRATDRRRPVLYGYELPTRPRWTRGSPSQRLSLLDRWSSSSPVAHVRAAARWAAAGTKRASCWPKRNTFTDLRHLRRDTTGQGRLGRVPTS